MEQRKEHQLLTQYAAIANCKLFASQSDLNPKDHAMPEMLAWCRKHDTIVVLQNGNILCSNPLSRDLQNCKVVMRNKGLAPGLVIPATRNLVNIVLANAVDNTIINELQTIQVSTQQQRLRMLVKEALKLDVTDIHIEVRKDIAQIRFRKHGELFLHAEWLPKIAKEIASVAFNKETDHAVTHFNPLVPQNASMPLHINSQEIRLRLASLPAHGGFDVVMRILTLAQENAFLLENLGYNEQQISMIKRAINMPSGAVIMAGPTGSGKTTTLASCLSLIHSDRKIFTIEDPVEKIVINATQIPVNTEHYDRSFASMARTVLRMDPDVIVLGEMRDEETAKEMMRAAITGHLVFSTLHTNTAPGIITRLMDLNISSTLLSNPGLLVCLICQRLVPLLCGHCKVPITDLPKLKTSLYLQQPLIQENLPQIFSRGRQPCSHCHGLGIADRTVVAEIIWIDERGRKFIQKENLLGWVNYLKNNGWKTYHDRLIELVLAGCCDPFDAEKVMGEMNSTDLFNKTVIENEFI